MTIQQIKNSVLELVPKYPVSKIILFGSRARESNHESSDVDLLVEFYEPITLLTLSQIKLELEELLELNVDIIHGPLTDSDLITVDEEVILYAA